MSPRRRVSASKSPFPRTWSTRASQFPALLKEKAAKNAEVAVEVAVAVVAAVADTPEKRVVRDTKDLRVREEREPREAREDSEAAEVVLVELEAAHAHQEPELNLFPPERAELMLELPMEVKKEEEVSEVAEVVPDPHTEREKMDTPDLLALIDPSRAKLAEVREEADSAVVLLAVAPDLLTEAVLVLLNEH